MSRDLHIYKYIIDRRIRKFQISIHPLSPLLWWSILYSHTALHVARKSLFRTRSRNVVRKIVENKNLCKIKILRSPKNITLTELSSHWCGGDSDRYVTLYASQKFPTKSEPSSTQNDPQKLRIHLKLFKNCWLQERKWRIFDNQKIKLHH